VTGFDMTMPLDAPEEGTREKIARALRGAVDRFRGLDPATGETDYWGRGGLSGMLGMEPWYNAPPQEIAEGFAGSITPAKGAALLKATQPIKAYHGSPHDFDKFDLSKIGTGEGAQAYGHGLYFAESPGVAQSYRDRLSPAEIKFKTGDLKDMNWEELRNAVADRVQAAGGNRDTAYSWAGSFNHNFARRDPTKGRIDEALAGWERPGPDSPFAFMRENPADFGGAEAVAQKDKTRELFVKAIRDLGPSDPGMRSSGKMYEVNIHADPERFLDWDKPVGDTPLRSRIEELGRQAVASDDPAFRNYGRDAVLASRNPNLTGEGVHNQIVRALDATRPQLKSRYGEEALFAKPTELARRELSEAGIPGIKYLDQGSRGSGTGTSNYVVFDDALIEILRKYGIAGLMGGGAASLGGASAEAAQ